MDFIKLIKNSFIALIFAVFASSASSFDANNHDASMLSESELKAMVDAAMKVNPPKNGKNYVFGFANLTGVFKVKRCRKQIRILIAAGCFRTIIPLARVLGKLESNFRYGKLLDLLFYLLLCFLFHWRVRVLLRRLKSKSK